MLQDEWEAGCLPGDRSSQRRCSMGDTFGSADSQAASRALKWIDLTCVSSPWTSHRHKGLGTSS